jgi:hypothetical protein
LCGDAARGAASGRRCRCLSLCRYRRLVGTAEACLEPGKVDATVMPVGKVFPADREQPQPLRFAETSPDPVRLTDCQRVCSAFRPNRARETHGLGLGFPAVAARAAFAVGVEELSAVAAPAQAESLPIPKVSDGSRQSANVRHQHPPPARHRGVLFRRGRTPACGGCTPVIPGSHPRRSMCSPAVSHRCVTSHRPFPFFPSKARNAAALA